MAGLFLARVLRWAGTAREPEAERAGALAAVERLSVVDFLAAFVVGFRVAGFAAA
jgi:hypothetical protein